MLSTNYSKKNVEINESEYILPNELIVENIKDNFSFNTGGKELRLQKVYGDELWNKINSLCQNIDWSNKEVMDICCGTGFVSYHLLSQVAPKKLTLLDISDTEINSARSLLSENYKNTKIEYVVGDFLKSNLMESSCDIIIGNSFLHHFYDLPFALDKISKMLKPGGIFISLHEPTTASRAYESRNPFYTILYMIRGKQYLDDCRFRGTGVKPGRGADVWIFTDSDLIGLFAKANLVVIKKVNWHFFKTIFTSVFGLYLKRDKPRLNYIQEKILRFGISIDSFLNDKLNEKFFSSVSIAAKKL